MKQFKYMLLVFVCVFTLALSAQNKQEVIRYINGVEKRLDSVRKSIMLYENEMQQKLTQLETQSNELKRNSKLLNEKRFEIDRLNETIKEKSEFIESQDWFLGVFMVVSLIALFAVVWLIATIRDKKKINADLEGKNGLIKKQVSELKLKNKEITDSIKYAKRIQEAILPAASEIKSLLPDSFVYFRPKDIVSGDFYWITEADNKIFFATADCTGHGVPGALMSMLGISFLNEIVNEKRIFRPADIMNELKRSIITALSKTDGTETMKDGMDMVICCLDKRNLKLTYAAANNGIYVLRNNNVIKLDAEKQPVGSNPKEHLHFNQFDFELNKNDLIVTYSDGFADQFGGPKGKKFKYKQLQDMFVQIAGKPLSTIPTLLNTVFEKWKGNHEQVDDILIVGIKV